MPDKKLTDNEIKKALECCTYEPKRHCIECPNNEDILGCALRLKIEAFELINRLQAENERLIGEVTTYKVRWAKATANLDTAKAEAYKEFAEKTNSIIDSLLEKYSIKDFEEFKAICQVLRGLKNDTYNLLKELVGEDNESKT